MIHNLTAMLCTQAGFIWANFNGSTTSFGIPSFTTYFTAGISWLAEVRHQGTSTTKSTLFCISTGNSETGSFYIGVGSNSGALICQTVNSTAVAQNSTKTVAIFTTTAYSGTVACLVSLPTETTTYPAGFSLLAEVRMSATGWWPCIYTSAMSGAAWEAQRIAVRITDSTYGLNVAYVFHNLPLTMAQYADFFTIGVTVHLGIVQNLSQMVIYRNGAVFTTTAWTNGLPLNYMRTRRYIGQSSPSVGDTGGFRGALSNIQIFNRALVASEVVAVYGNYSATSFMPSNCVGWYKLDGGPSDSSGLGLHGASTVTVVYTATTYSISVAGVVTSTVALTNFFTLSTTTHVQVLATNSQVTIYKNGSVYTVSALMTPTNVAHIYNYLGSSWAGEKFKGVIRNTQLYSRALVASEAVAWYNDTNTTRYFSNCVFWFKLNSLTTDASGLGLSGSGTNLTWTSTTS